MFGLKKIKKYTNVELNRYKETVEKNFGVISNEYEFNKKIKTIKKYGITLELIEPTNDKPYYYLLTKGFANYAFNAYGNPALSHAELYLVLPEFWNPVSDNRDRNWPTILISLLLDTIITDKLPIYGGASFNIAPYNFDDFKYALIGATDITFELENKETVEFFSINTILEDEIRLVEHTNNYLLAGAFFDMCIPCSKYRESVLNSSVWATTSMCEVDNGTYHKEKLIEKEFDKKYNIDVMNSYSHLAIFLRYMIENDMVNILFKEYFKAAYEGIKNNPSTFDIRRFIQDELKGVLPMLIFTAEASRIVGLMYFNSDSYPEYIDKYCEKYFEGTDTAYMDTEEYLFIPYTEKYYQDIKAEYLEKKVKELANIG